jgi:hypothetical protein
MSQSRFKTIQQAREEKEKSETLHWVDQRLVGRKQFDSTYSSMAQNLFEIWNEFARERALLRSTIHPNSDLKKIFLSYGEYYRRNFLLSFLENGSLQLIQPAIWILEDLGDATDLAQVIADEFHCSVDFRRESISIYESEFICTVQPQRLEATG